MVSTLINEYLISRTHGLPLKTEKKLEQKLGFNLVTDNYLMNDLIAGSFGWEYVRDGIRYIDEVCETLLEAFRWGWKFWGC